MALSWKKAKQLNLLSERDIERLAAAMLTIADTARPNFEVAAAAYGGVSGSYRNAWHAMMKKLRENNCYIDDDAGAKAGGAPTTPTTPATAASAKKTGAGKRKAATDLDDAEEDDEPAADETPAGKKKRRAGRPRAARGKTVDVAAEESVETCEVKEEVVSDAGGVEI